RNHRRGYQHVLWRKAYADLCLRKHEAEGVQRARRQSMRICTDKERPRRSPIRTQFDDGLGQRRHVFVLETAAQTAATMPACPKAYRRQRRKVALGIGVA